RTLTPGPSPRVGRREPEVGPSPPPSAAAGEGAGGGGERGVGLGGRGIENGRLEGRPFRGAARGALGLGGLVRGGGRGLVLIVRGLVLGSAGFAAELADALTERTTEVSHAGGSEEQRENNQDDQQLLPTQASDHDPVPFRPVPPKVGARNRSTTCGCGVPGTLSAVVH